MHNNFSSCRSKWVSSDIMMTIHHGAGRDQWVDLGWSEQVDGMLAARQKQVPVSAIRALVCAGSH